MPTKFFTNIEDNNVLKKFEETLKRITNLIHFDVLVGYFRVSGYYKLQKFLNDFPKIRILVGINVDNLTKKYHYSLSMILSIGFRVRSKRGTQFRIWANQNLKEYLIKGFVLDDYRLKNPDGRPDYFDEL